MGILSRYQCQMTEFSQVKGRVSGCAGAASLAKLPALIKEENVMGLFRLLLLIAIVAAAFWVWRRFARTAPHANTKKPGPVPMVRCEHCGIHVPREHAFVQDQYWYCSQAHLELGRKPGEH